MKRDLFESALRALASECKKKLSLTNGEWVVKGFIDVFKNVYGMPGDTKVVSKIVELMLLPTFAKFASDNDLKLVLTREQNHYPDLSFVAKDGTKFAVDLKTTYRIDNETVNTMTLGAFTGYFRERTSTKNATFSYGSYVAHYVFGVIYDRSKNIPSESEHFSVDNIEKIPSVIGNLEFFVQPKFKVAKDQPGSGNTKNIGAISQTADLLAGNGPFAKLGEEVFDDYWMYYLTKDMARAAEIREPPYKNLKGYFSYKKPPEKS